MVTSSGQQLGGLADATGLDGLGQGIRDATATAGDAIDGATNTRWPCSRRAARAPVSICINPSDNRGAGSSMEGQIRGQGLKDGDRVRIVVG